MSSYLELPDGTEFQIKYALSGRAILVGFEESMLERLLSLSEAENVVLDDKSMTLGEARRKLTKIVAYIPNAADYLKVANKL